MRKQKLRTRLSEIGTWLLIIPVFLIVAPYFYLRAAVVHLVRWLSRTPKLILLEKKDILDSESQHWLRQEIERLIPIGSPLVRAEKILKRNGFKISKESEEGRHSLSAEKYKPYLRAFFLVSWEWHVTLDYADGRITSITGVSSYITGL